MDNDSGTFLHHAGIAVDWKTDPDDHDYAAALDYLELNLDPGDAQAVVYALRQTTTTTKRAKDIIRAAGLPLLDPSNPHVQHNIAKARAGKPWSPILLVRGEPLLIADGYHRACAAYYLSEDTAVRCRIAS